MLRGRFLSINAVLCLESSNRSDYSVNWLNTNIWFAIWTRHSSSLSSCVYTYLYENVIIHKDTYMTHIIGLSFQTMKPLL